MTDPLGRVTTFAYDRLDRLGRKTRCQFMFSPVVVTGPDPRGAAYTDYTVTT